MHKIYAHRNLFEGGLNKKGERNRSHIKKIKEMMGALRRMEMCGKRWQKNREV